MARKGEFKIQKSILNCTSVRIISFGVLIAIIIIMNIIFTNLIRNENLKDGNLVVPGEIINNELSTSLQNPITVIDLEKKYGQLARIILKNGKEYIGAFYTKDEDLVLITTKGECVISSSQVRIVMPYIIKKRNFH